MRYKQKLLWFYKDDLDLSSSHSLWLSSLAFHSGLWDPDLGTGTRHMVLENPPNPPANAALSHEVRNRWSEEARPVHTLITHTLYFQPACISYSCHLTLNLPPKREAILYGSVKYLLPRSPLQEHRTHLAKRGKRKMEMFRQAQGHF